MQKYILFDFDGTIADTNELILLALNKTAEKYMGRRLETDEINSILGKYLEDQMKQLCPEKYMDMVLFYKEFYKAHMDDMTKEFPGIREMLSELKLLGCKTAIVSAKGRSGIEHGLEKLGITQFIDVIISAYDIKNNKPHAEPALKALDMLGCPGFNDFGIRDSCNSNHSVPDCLQESRFSKECFTLLVGDSPYDILCGKNAGIKTALVDWTIFPKGPLLELKPDFYINKASDLTEIIRLLPS